MRTENMQTFSLVDYFTPKAASSVLTFYMIFLCSVCIILPFIFNHQAQKFFKYLRKIQTNDKNNYNNDNNKNKFTSMIFMYLHSFIHRFTGLLGTNIIAISQLGC